MNNNFDKLENIILGTMNIHNPFSSCSNISEEYYKDLIEKYIYYVGKNAILDTAYYYGNTTCEQVLGNIIPNLSENCKISTKVNPWLNNDFLLNKYGQLSNENLKKQFETSLKNLKLKNVEILFLHCPDNETSIVETLETCNELLRKEKFNYLGISNYSANQLIQILEICEQNGYPLPKYYQGMYNLIARKIEEIFPTLNKHGIEFWAYNPLAGGLLTGKYNTKLKENLPLGRFKNNLIYQNIFWKEPIIKQLNSHFFHFKKEKCLQYSYKWLNSYSKMNNKDKIIIGASSIEQLDQNLKILQKEKNSIDNLITMKYLNDIYEPIKEYTPNYYY
jgi:aflatoxin B1 aldehyde reductase